MEYEYLIGHRVKINYFHNARKDKNEFIGPVSKVIIDRNNEERIYVAKDDKRNNEWVKPFGKSIIDFHVEILDNKYTKFTRFEIMEI